MNPKICMAAATQQTMANIHFAKEGVDAPTTMSEVSR